MRENEKEKYPEAFEKAEILAEMLEKANLSPLEKFLLIHDFCASKPYFQVSNGVVLKGFGPSMQTNQIDCFGYAQIMCVLCDMVGIECHEISGRRRGVGGHSYNCVHLVDEKYKIDDYYICDSCWDSEEHFRAKGLMCYAYALMPLQDVSLDQHNDYNPTLDLKIQKLPTKTKHIIDIETFVDALNTAYAGILGGKSETKTKQSQLIGLFDIFRKSSYEKNIDDIEYQKFQDGTLNKNYELDYYKERIDQSIETTVDAVSKCAFKMPSKSIKTCFYNYGMHMKYLEETAERRKEKNNMSLTM